MSNERKFLALPLSASSDRLSRRSVLKRAAAFGLATPAVMALLAACGGDDDASETPASSGGASGESTAAATASGESTATATTTSNETATAEAGTATAQAQGQRGGTLRVAQFQEAPTLDIHTVTSSETGNIGLNMYETLFSWSDNYEVIPMLAESHEVSDDGLLHTVTIRQGVPFHNGQEMTAADVVASIQRWGTRNSVGKDMLALVDEITEVDDYTIEFQFTEPYSIFASAVGLISQGAAIYPESVITAAGEDDVAEYIGTGPYKFVKWDSGQEIRLERFEEYAALPGEPNGYGGHKYAYLDAIEFIGVADEAARVAGLRAGDYGHAERISGDQIPVLEEDDSISVRSVDGGGWDMFLLNWRSPITGDLKVRQAIQAALDHGPILTAGRGAGFFELYPSIMPKETAWYTEAGGELYNQNDPEKAMQLLEEAGYDGTPLRLMTTQADVSKYQACVVIKQQLEEAGFVIDLQIMDWATVMDRRVQEDLWEGLVTKTFFEPEPTFLNPFKLCDYAGWWCSDDSAAALEGMMTESDFDLRFQYWEQLQTLFFQEVPAIMLGQINDTLIHSAALQGVPAQAQLGANLTSAWLEE